MHYLYGRKNEGAWQLAATFDSEQQLLAYVRWATLEGSADQSARFEQGSALVGYATARHAQTPLTTQDAAGVPHNPSPSML